MTKFDVAAAEDAFKEAQAWRWKDGAPAMDNTLRSGPKTWRMNHD